MDFGKISWYSRGVLDVKRWRNWLITIRYGEKIVVIGVVYSRGSVVYFRRRFVYFRGLFVYFRKVIVYFRGVFMYSR